MTKQNSTICQHQQGCHNGCFKPYKRLQEIMEVDQMNGWLVGITNRQCSLDNVNTIPYLS